MGFLGAIGRAVGGVPGMKTMNKAMPGGGMPMGQPKPQLGGGLGPSIKSQMQPPGQMKQMMPPQGQMPPNGTPIQPPMQKQFPQMGQGGFLPTSPQGGGFQMPPWARGGMNGRMGGGMMGPSPNFMQQMRPQMGGNTGFAGGMMKPHVMPNLQRNPNSQIYT